MWKPHMHKPIVYLDNAATSYPKPESVYIAHDSYLRSAGNPGRGGHALALNSARTTFDARTAIAQFLGADYAERLVFTPSCTHSINTVLKGIDFKSGDTVVVSALEHNATMRPLHALKQTCDIRIHTLSYAQSGIIDPEELRQTLKSVKPRLCAFLEASNVTGERIDLDQVAQICDAASSPLLIDAAQTAGTMDKVLSHPGITYWAASGHKGFMGAPGVGLLYCRPGHEIEPLVQGGTGSASEQFEMPDAYPDKLQAGTLPGPAIAALKAGCAFIAKTGAQRIFSYEQALANEFRTWCRKNGWITLPGNSFRSGSSASDAHPVVSIFPE